MEKCSRALWVALVFGVACAGSAVAQEAKDAAKDAAQDPLSFEVADANHDGFISRSEVPKQLNDVRAHFAQYDKDGDHRLSRREYNDALAATGATRPCDNHEVSQTKTSCGDALDPGITRREAPVAQPSPHPPQSSGSRGR